MNRPQISRALIGFTLAGLALPAHAYLDPSTGSMIISAIVGLFASAALALKTWWYKLKNFFRRREPGQTDAATAAAPDATSDGGSVPRR